MGAVKDAPEWQRFDTESYEKGKAVCITTVPQPISLIEGYLQGYITMYGYSVATMETVEVDGAEHTTHRITITWDS